MRAKFINEKFKEYSDPIRDLAIGSKFLRIEIFDLVKLKKDISYTSFEHIFKTRFKGALLKLGTTGVVQDIKFNSSKNILKLQLIFFNTIDDAVQGRAYIKYYGSHICIDIFPEALISNWDKYFEIIKQDSLTESLNEKFKLDVDPIKSMNIGYSKRTLNSMSWKILKFIENKGKEGASLKEIQYFIWVENGNDPKKFFEKSDYDQRSPSQRKTRGYWNTNLLGSYMSHEGLLHKFCYKNDKKRWVLKRFPKPDENFYDWVRR